MRRPLAALLSCSLPGCGPGMALIDRVHRGRAEEFGVLGRRELRRKRRSPTRRSAEGITPLNSHQQEYGFARLSAVGDQDLAKTHAFACRKSEIFEGL